MIIYEQYPKNYFLKRMMSDEKSEGLRANYIAQGLITPDRDGLLPGQKPFTVTAKYKERLVKSGIITPGRPIETTFPRSRVTIIRPVNH